MGCPTDFIQFNRGWSEATRERRWGCPNGRRPQSDGFEVTGLELGWFDGKEFKKFNQEPFQSPQAMSCEQIPNNTYNVYPRSPLKEKNLPRDPNARIELARFNEFFRHYPMLTPEAAEQYRIAISDVDQNKRVSIGDLFYIGKRDSESCWAVPVRVTPANLRYFQGARVVWARKPPDPIVQR